MRRILIFLILCFSFACTKTVYVPCERVTTVRETERDTIVLTQIEREEVLVETPDTCAHAETIYAVADANVRKGKLTLRLHNKDETIPVKAKFKLREIRDSIPYPVEVPVVVKERYVAWYDKAARALSGVVIMIIFAKIVSKVWKRGGLPF